MPAINQVSFQSPYQAEAGEIERRRRLADALQAQAMEPLQAPPTPAGGFAVPISPMQGMAKIAQALSASYGQSRARDDQRALGERFNRDRASMITQALEAGQGRPATPESYSGEPGADELYNPAREEVKPDRMRTYQALAANQIDPQLQTLGMTELLKKPEQTIVPANASVLGPNNELKFTAPGPAPRPVADNRPPLLRLQEARNKMLPTDPDREELQRAIDLMTTEQTPKAANPSDLARYQAEREALLAAGKPTTAHDNAIRKISETARQITPTVILEKGGPKLKPGERETPDGRVEAIPGSSEYVKQSGLHGKDYKAALTVNAQTDNAIAKIAEILDPKKSGDFNSNFGGYNALATQFLPGAQDMRQKIESLKSDLKMAGLTMMRSGGGIGSMTVSEWPIVERMIDSISPTLDEQTARDTFAKVQAHMERLRENAGEVYNSTWGETQFHKKDLSRRAGEREPATPQRRSGDIRPAPIAPQRRAADAKPPAGAVMRFDAQGNPIP